VEKNSADIVYQEFGRENSMIQIIWTTEQKLLVHLKRTDGE
jgi:hypothetical protein